MNKTPKNVLKWNWDKDKRLVKNYQMSYVGNYTDEKSNMENFNFDKWLDVEQGSLTKREKNVLFTVLYCKINLNRRYYD